MASDAAGTSHGTPGVDPAAQDVGNAVHLEHVNLEVPDLDLARVFYSEGLGLTPDPDTLGWQRGGPFVTWYNLGRQQLHIIKGPAQSTGGLITLKLRATGDGSSGGLQRAAERLAALRPTLEGTQYSFTVHHHPGAVIQQQQQGSDSAGSSGGGSKGGSGGTLATSSPHIAAISVCDPWGQRFCLVDDAPGFPWPAGIVDLQLPCFPGTAHLIACFYSELLGARVVENGSAGGGSSGLRASHAGSGGSEAAAGCRVLLGPGSSLCFQEEASLGERTPQAVEGLWSGWHVAFYTAAFGPAFQRALDLGINLLDHPYRDKSPDVAAALANRQFRFKDVVHLDAFGKRGELLYCLGHEVRSLHHPGFMRPLYNRRDGL